MLRRTEHYELEFRRKPGKGRWHAWGSAASSLDGAQFIRDAAKRVESQRSWEFRILRVSSTEEVVE